MTQLYRIKLCCKPLVMIMIRSSELDWVMIEVWNYMCVIVENMRLIE